MAEFKYLPLFTDALLADCSHLSDAEFGLYVRILIAMWRSPGCRIPGNAEWLEKRFRCPITVIGPLLAEFCQSDGAFWTQKRLLKEFGHARQVVDKNRGAAKSRWKKEKDPCERNAPIPIPIPKKEGGGVYAQAREGKVPLAVKGEMLANIVGWDLARWTGNYSRLDAWLTQGFDFDLDIVPAVREVMAKKTDGPPASLAYFDKAIARYREERLRPVPKAEPRTGKPEKKSFSRGLMEAAARAAENAERRHNAKRSDQGTDDLP